MSPYIKCRMEVPAIRRAIYDLFVQNHFSGMLVSDCNNNKAFPYIFLSDDELLGGFATESSSIGREGRVATLEEIIRKITKRFTVITGSNGEIIRIFLNGNISFNGTIIDKQVVDDIVETRNKLMAP